MAPPTALDLQGCWINGRTLRLAVRETGASRSRGDVGVRARVAIDLRRDARLLGADLRHPFPFSTAQGVMATVRDVGVAAPQIHEFDQFRFTASAFQSSLHWVQAEDARTGIDAQALEALGREVLAGAPDKAYGFSGQVCKWGRGERVWGNLARHYTADTLALHLCEWFARVAQARNASEAIEGGIAIKGLHVSFASKHLRFLAPDRYAVLDEVLSEGLGFALNPAGYGFFMRTLQAFKRRYALAHTLAQIEWALFGLVRQSVRGQPMTAHDGAARLAA